MTPLAKSYQDLIAIEPNDRGFYTWLNGYFMRFISDANEAMTTVDIPLATLSDTHAELIRQRMSEYQSDKRVKKIQLDGNKLSYIFVKRAFGRKSQPQETIDFLQTETDWLRSLGVNPGCSRCGLEGVHEVSRLHGHDQPLCPSCQVAHRQELSQTLSQDETGRNYLTGILGAILGAAIGAALFFGVAYFSNRLFSVLAIIIGLLSVWLYRTFKGKLTVLGGVIVGIVTLVVAVLGYFVYVYFLMRQVYDITVATFIKNLSAIMGIEGMTSDLIFYLLFVVLSVFLSMTSFLKDIKQRKATMDELGINSSNDVV